MSLEQQTFNLQAIVDGFFDRLDRFGLEAFRKYYGVYRGFVVDTADPEKRGRVKAYSPDIGQSESNFPDIWIDPAFSSAGANHGAFCPPEIGDCVRLFFSAGEPGFPVLYLGGWYGAPDGATELPNELKYSGNGYPERRGFVTRMGHSVVFSDEKDQEEIKITWHKADPTDEAQNDRTKSANRSSGKTASLKFDKDGSIFIENESHSKVVMDGQGITITDKDGNVITLAGGKCDVKISGGFTVQGSSADIKTQTVTLGTGASASAVLGEAFMGLFNAHVHPTGVGPSGPPATPATPAILSQSVKIKP